MELETCRALVYDVYEPVKKSQNHHYLTGSYGQLPDTRAGAAQVAAEDADGMDRRPEGTRPYFQNVEVGRR